MSGAFIIGDDVYVIFKITHHVDAGYRYSRVYGRCAWGTTMVFRQGHL